MSIDAVCTPQDDRKVRGKFLSGAKLAIPIVMGYLPIGIAYGVIARHSGLSVAEAVLMSVLVFAGSAQFIAAGMLSAGAAAAAIISTTFVVNLRHVLFSMSMVGRLKHLPRPVQALLAFGLTDESYGVATVQFPPDAPTDWREAAGLNFTAYAGWVGSSALGAILGSAITDAARFGVDFVLPAMFIGLLLMQLRGRISAVVAVIAGAVAVAVAVSPLGQWNIIIATTAAAALGVVVEGAERGSGRAADGRSRDGYRNGEGRRRGEGRGNRAEHNNAQARKGREEPWNGVKGARRP